MAVEINSKRAVVSKAPYELYMGFTDMRNFIQLLPEDKKEGVVADGNIITGRGPGWAVEFGLTILEHLKGKEVADKVKAGLML